MKNPSFGVGCARCARWFCTPINILIIYLQRELILKELGYSIAYRIRWHRWHGGGNRTDTTRGPKIDSATRTHAIGAGVRTHKGKER